VDLFPTAGTTFVNPRGPEGTHVLTQGEQVGVGSIVNTLDGVVTLQSASDTGGGQQSAQFFDGRFEVVQTASNSFSPRSCSTARARARAAATRKLTTELRLIGGAFQGCPPAVPAARAASSRSVATVARRRRRRRRLWGRGRGRFRTRGRYAAGSVRGTTWLTEDRCNGTFFRVLKGSILVHSFVTGRNRIVRAGHSYLAPARKPRRRRRPCGIRLEQVSGRPPVIRRLGPGRICLTQRIGGRTQSQTTPRRR
jgi:hypothetical protein